MILFHKETKNKINLKIRADIIHAALKQKSSFICVQAVFIDKTFGDFVKVTL